MQLKYFCHVQSNKHIIYFFLHFGKSFSGFPSNPRPCFRALNDTVCLLYTDKRYQKDIYIEYMMIRIDTKFANYQG